MYLTIPSHGTGQVRMTVVGERLTVSDARSADGREIAVGQIVTAVEPLPDGVVVVEPEHAGLIKSLPPLHDVAAMAGVELPNYLGSIKGDNDVPASQEQPVTDEDLMGVPHATATTV